MIKLWNWNETPTEIKDHLNLDPKHGKPTWVAEIPTSETNIKNQDLFGNHTVSSHRIPDNPNEIRVGHEG